MLRVHHLSCGTMCPLGGKYTDGFSKGISSKLTCHCLAIETNSGLVLVDTGFGMLDVQYPEKRLSAFFRNFNRIQLEEERTALRQIEQLGFKREDVRHIVLTHLDFDHAGGLSDFPHAQIHLMKDEYNTATHSQRTWLERQRYSVPQFGNTSNWNLYNPRGEAWYGFESVHQLNGLPPEILLVPLVGHTWGHAGVAIQTMKGWLLHAGDAYFYRGEMNPHGYKCTAGLRLYQALMEADRPSRLWNQKRLRALVQNYRHEVKVFSSHDVLELDFFKKAEQKEALERRLNQWTSKHPDQSPPPPPSSL